MISRDVVLKIAQLSHLNLSEGEIEEMTTKLSAILDYMKVLDKVDINGVEAMSHAQGSTNVFREDQIEPSMPREEALANAPARNGPFIRVPLVIEQ